MAEFSLHYSVEFKEWYETNNYVVALETVNETSLYELYEKSSKKHSIIGVYEPDIGHKLTAIIFVPDDTVYKTLSSIACIGRDDKREEHVKNMKQTVRELNNV